MVFCMYVFMVDLKECPSIDWGWPIHHLFECPVGHVGRQSRDRRRFPHWETLPILSHVDICWTSWPSRTKGIQRPTHDPIQCVSLISAIIIIIIIIIIIVVVVVIIIIIATIIIINIKYDDRQNPLSTPLTPALPSSSLSSLDLFCMIITFRSL